MLHITFVSLFFCVFQQSVCWEPHISVEMVLYSEEKLRHKDPESLFVLLAHLIPSVNSADLICSDSSNSGGSVEVQFQDSAQPPPGP